MEEYIALNGSAYLAVAIARNQNAYEKAKAYYNKNVAACEAAALRCGYINHVAISSCRFEIQLKARQVLGLLYTMSCDELLIIIKAGWRRLLDAVKTERSEQEFNNIYLSAPNLDIQIDTIIVHAWLSYFLGKSAPRESLLENLSGIAAFHEHGVPGRLEKDKLSAKSKMDANIFYPSKDKTGWTAISIDADEFGGAFYAIGTLYDFDLSSYISDIEFTKTDRAACCELANGRKEIIQPLAIFCMMLKALLKDKKFFFQSYAERIRADAAVQKKNAQEVAQKLSAKEYAYKQLESETSKLREKLEIEQNEVERLKAELSSHDGDAQELAALRDALFHAELDEDDFDEEVTLPLEGRKVVSIGGGAKWLTGMRSACPSVTFIPADVSMDMDVIRGADEVWLQALMIGHPQSNAVRNCCRSHGIPVFYYTSLSVKRSVADLLRKR